MDYKDTVNLPKTLFPMKASLDKLEQELLQRWEQKHIYQQLRQKYADRPKYILHDGRPMPMGTFISAPPLTKSSKTSWCVSRAWKAITPCTCRAGIAMACRLSSRSISNSETRKREMTKADIRQGCRAYAAAASRSRGKSSSVWASSATGKPLPDHELWLRSHDARELAIFWAWRALQGGKPVHWCSSCRTALAEAEVEYDDRTPYSIYVKFPLKESRRRPAFLQGKNASCHLDHHPLDNARQPGARLHPSYEYVWPETNREVFLLRRNLSICSPRLGLRRITSATPSGPSLRKADCSPPLYRPPFSHPAGQHVTLEARHRVRPYRSRPRP